jgi:hypothetical protein
MTELCQIPVLEQSHRLALRHTGKFGHIWSFCVQHRDYIHPLIYANTMSRQIVLNIGFGITACRLAFKKAMVEEFRLTL